MNQSTPPELSGQPNNKASYRELSHLRLKENELISLKYQLSGNSFGCSKERREIQSNNHFNPVITWLHGLNIWVGPSGYVWFCLCETHCCVWFKFDFVTRIDLRSAPAMWVNWWDISLLSWPSEVLTVLWKGRITIQSVVVFEAECVAYTSKMLFNV